jgi:hypothetical protein
MKYEYNGKKLNHLQLVKSGPNSVKSLTWGSSEFIKRAKQGENDYEAQAERERELAEYWRKV